MTLSFSTHVNNEPTYFVERVWASIPFDHLRSFYMKEYEVDFTNEGEVEAFILDKCGHTVNFSKYHDFVRSDLRKPHSIRIDAPKRWRVGMDIHFVIFNRTPRRFQFAPILKVSSVEEITIQHRGDQKRVEVCGRALSIKQCNILAVYDGFENLRSFFRWFDKDFKGRIIHWNGLRYCP